MNRDLGCFKSMSAACDNAIWITNADDVPVCTNGALRDLLESNLGKAPGYTWFGAAILDDEIGQQLSFCYQAARQKLRPVSCSGSGLCANATGSHQYMGSFTPLSANGRFSGMICVLAFYESSETTCILQADRFDFHRSSPKQHLPQLPHTSSPKHEIINAAHTLQLGLGLLSHFWEDLLIHFEEYNEGSHESFSGITEQELPVTCVPSIISGLIQSAHKIELLLAGHHELASTTLEGDAEAHGAYARRN